MNEGAHRAEAGKGHIEEDVWIKGDAKVGWLGFKEQLDEHGIVGGDKLRAVIKGMDDLLPLMPNTIEVVDYGEVLVL